MFRELKNVILKFPTFCRIPYPIGSMLRANFACHLSYKHERLSIYWPASTSVSLSVIASKCPGPMLAKWGSRLYSMWERGGGGPYRDLSLLSQWRPYKCDTSWNTASFSHNGGLKCQDDGRNPSEGVMRCVSRRWQGCPQRMSALNPTVMPQTAKGTLCIQTILIVRDGRVCQTYR